MKISGNGTIEKLGKGIYRIRFNLGKDPLTKKYRYAPWRRVRGTEKDARRALEEYRRELEGGLRYDLVDITFREFAEVFREGRVNSKTLASATLDDDKCIINHLNKHLGDIRIVDIDTELIKGVIANMIYEGMGKPRIHDVVIKLKQIIKEAVLEGIIFKNPCERVPTPKCPKPVRNSLKAYEAAFLQEILDAMPLDRNTIALYIGLATGMRKGEVFGLRWGDTDLRDGIINVAHSLDRDKNLKEPKSDSGNRRITIDAHTVSKLKLWKCEQDECLLKQEVTLDDYTPVCATRNGGFCGTSRFYYWFKNFCVDNGFGVFVDEDGNVLPKRRFNEKGFPVDEDGKPYSTSNKKPRVKKYYRGLKFHELRHTHATLLIANKVDIKTVQNRLGHAKAALTLDFYAHADDECDRQASNLFSALLQSEAPRQKAVGF